MKLADKIILICCLVALVLLIIGAVQSKGDTIITIPDDGPITIRVEDGPWSFEPPSNPRALKSAITKLKSEIK